MAPHAPLVSPGGLRRRPPVRHAAWLAAALIGLAAAGPLAAQAPAPAPAPIQASATEPRFDLALNQAPAAQVFLQLAMGSDWQVLVSPEVGGSITLNLRDTSLPEALEALRELYGYDYRIAGRRVYVQPNTVQTRLFRVNYLPGRRQGTSDLQVSSASIAQSGNGGSGGGAYGGTAGNPAGGTSGSTAGARTDHSASVRTSSDADFWRDVKASLQALLGLGDEGPAAASGPRRSLVLNPAAGVIVVRATPAELRQVQDYLQVVQLSIERQVMLEAKILEVELGESSQAGINWSAFGRALGGAYSLGQAQPGVSLAGSGALTINGGSVTPGGTLAASTSSPGFYGLAFQSTHFAALLNFLDTQGQVQVLSSPRIATLNNQKAVLKVGSDELYVTGVSSTTTSTGSTSTSTPSVVLQPFFSGISLDVTPQIGEEGQVMLHVHPAISTVSEKQKNINLGSLGSYQLPLASSTINETDSIVRVRDGQIVAIGGLMSQEQREDRSGVTGLSRLPVLGGLFRQKATLTRKRELVILIKPSVIRDDGPWPEADPAAPAGALPPPFPWQPPAGAGQPPGGSAPRGEAPATAGARPLLAIDGRTAAVPNPMPSPLPATAEPAAPTPANAPR